MSAFVIDFSGVTPKVTIDGKPLDAPLRHVAANQSHGEFPQVTLVLDASSVKIEGKGDITPVSALSVGAFLDDVDPEQLESEALARSDFSQNPTAVMLDILRERADGA